MQLREEGAQLQPRAAGAHLQPRAAGALLYPPCPWGLLQPMAEGALLYLPAGQQGGGIIVFSRSGPGRSDRPGPRLVTSRWMSSAPLPTAQAGPLPRQHPVLPGSATGGLSEWAANWGVACGWRGGGYHPTWAGLNTPPAQLTMPATIPGTDRPTAPSPLCTAPPENRIVIP